MSEDREEKNNIVYGNVILKKSAICNNWCYVLNTVKVKLMKLLKMWEIW